jgi:hypothetical protein
MTAIAISKVLLLGCGGALGYYFVISYVFLHFPMPFFLGADTLLQSWVLEKEVAEEKRHNFWWRVGKGILNVLMLAAWWLVFGGFAYLLYFALQYYLPDAGAWFWYYYGIALALPAVLVLVQSVLFFRKKPVTLIDLPEDHRSLLEQMTTPGLRLPD